MRSFRLSVAMLALAAGIAMGGCSDSSDNSPITNQPPVAPPAPGPAPEPVVVDFTRFVIDQFAATADDTEPESVDDTDFEFNDQENPDAFSGLLSGP